MKRRTGNLFQRKPGGNYYLRVMVKGTAIVKSTGTANKRKAEKIRREMMLPFQAGDEEEILKSVAVKLESTQAKAKKLNDELNPPPKIENVFNRFLESPERPDASERTLQGYESIWRRFKKWLTKTESNIEYLHEVTPAMVKAYAKHLKECKVSASTFNQHKNLLRMVWRIMADECRLDGNPWEKIQSMKLQPLKTRKRALTQSQFESLLAAVEDYPDLKDLFVVLAWTGLRLGDAVLLKWSSVDFKKMIISLAPAKTARQQGKLVHIPIFPATEEVLNRRQGQLVNPRGFVFPGLAEQYERDNVSISKDIKAAFGRAGMKTNEKRAGRKRAVVVHGAHSLRHFFVTAAASAGMPAAMIKSITGHATDDMLEHYQQLGVEYASKMAGFIRTEPKQIAATDAPDKMAEIKELVEKLNGKNWKKIKDKLIEML